MQRFVQKIRAGLVLLFLRFRRCLVGQIVFKFAAPDGIVLTQADDGLAAALFAGDAVFKDLRSTVKEAAISRKHLGAVIGVVRQSCVRED